MSAECGMMHDESGRSSLIIPHSALEELYRQVISLRETLRDLATNPLKL